MHTPGLIKKYPANVCENSVFFAKSFLSSCYWRQLQGGFEQFKNGSMCTCDSPSKNGSMCDPPLLLRELQPYAKFVVLLREPINRLYSAFWFYAGIKDQKELSPEIFIEDTQTFLNA